MRASLLIGIIVFMSLASGVQAQSGRDNNTSSNLDTPWYEGYDFS